MRSLSQLLNGQKPLKFSMEFMGFVEEELSNNKYNSQRGSVERQIVNLAASKDWSHTGYNLFMSGFSGVTGFKLLLDKDNNVIDYVDNADYFEYRHGFVCKFVKAENDKRSMLVAVYNSDGVKVLDLESDLNLYRNSDLEIIHASCGDFALLSTNNTGRTIGKIHEDFELFSVNNDKWVRIKKFEADSYKVFETVKNKDSVGGLREFKPYIEYICMENPDNVPELKYINRTNERRSGWCGMTWTIPVKYLLNLETGEELVYVEIGYAKEALIRSNDKAVDKLIKQSRKTGVFIDDLEKYQYNELTGHGRNPVGVHGLKVDDLSRRSVENVVLFKLLHKKYILGEIRV